LSLFGVYFWIVEAMLSSKPSIAKTSWALPVLFAIFFVSGFTALLYQVVWQRMLGLFSGSDVRSVTIVVASYLAGLGLGSLIGGILSDRLSNRQIVQTYGFCNLGIAAFAVFSRFLFYDLLFLQLRDLARSPALMLSIVFISLLIPTILMGLSLPLLSKAIGRSANKAAPRIGLLYGVNTLGSGLGSLISGWYIIGTLGYEGTVYLGAILNALVGIVALGSAYQFERDRSSQNAEIVTVNQPKVRSVKEWCLLVFLSGFVAISLEIIWFRVLDVALQSNAYTYAHLLAFILASNAVGSLLGAKAIRYIRKPRQVFLSIQGIVAAYSAIAIWLIGLYWQSHPNLRADIGYIDPKNISAAVVFKYLLLPMVMIVLPNLLLGFYFPLVQKAVQTDDRTIGQRVGLILVANILGNTTGSLLTGLLLLDKLGTAGSLQLLALLGLGFVLAIRPNWVRAKFIGALALILLATVVFFPTNTRLWKPLHGIEPQEYFLVAEDSTGVAAIGETNRQGTLFASGQAEANFPYMHVHALLGTIPALLHPNPAQVMIIGLGSGGTPHTIGVNPLTQNVRIVEILGAELPVLREYAKTPVGKPLSFLFQDPRYAIIVGDGRRELVIADRKFDIIEADAIQPWRSRAGMLYSQEFFQEVRSRLAPGGFFVEWNVGTEAEQTFRNVFPYVTRLDLSGNLSVLIGSEHLVDFNREALLTKLDSPAVLDFLAKAGVNVEGIRTDVKAAGLQIYSHAKDGQPKAINTDLFPRSEYYLNRPSS
jgi:predicted membrane-bound spermidine synthase